MADRVLRKKLERVRRYLERGRPVIVRTRARRAAPLDEETLLGHYERLAFVLRAMPWRWRGRLVGAREAVLELQALREPS